VDAVIRWRDLLALIVPRYAVAARGRRPLPLGTMLRVDVLPQWFALADLHAVAMRSERESMGRAARIEWGDDTAPDESTSVRLRRLLDQHPLIPHISYPVLARLQCTQRVPTGGPMVDATIIAVLSSTKTASGIRDPEMTQTCNGQRWNFEMSLQVGTDRRGARHSLTTTDAATPDLSALPHPLQGSDTDFSGDRASSNREHQQLWIESERAVLRRSAWSDAAGGRAESHAVTHPGHT
jgi:transposase, IS5 family